MNKKVLVVGSLNMDFSINVDKLPVPGETVLANDFNLVPGGKGANQAYALGKLGANVSMIGAVGDDSYGKALIDNLKSVNVDTEGIKVFPNEKTGCAFVNVDSNGENNIIAVGGANLKVSKALIDENIDKIYSADYIVMQLEVPINTIKYVVDIAKKLNKTVILDPAPAKSDIDNILYGIDIMKPNITELEILTNTKINSNNDVVCAAKKLLDIGVRNVIVTLGNDGSILVNKDKTKHFETLKVEAVDSTAAGDSFIAALVKSLAEGKDLESSIKFGHIVSSFCVTKKGAQTSIPTPKELSDFIKVIKNIKKENIIIDADPGVDDVFAILLALSSKELDLKAITTVSGNCSLENATDNTFKILDLCGRKDIPVYKGMKKALVKSDVDAKHVHGNNGLGGIIYDKIDKIAEDMHAVDYLVETINNHPKEFSIVALGPLTNIAKAIEKNNEFSKNLKRLIIMGGAENLGNITPFAEFNFYKDPHAVKQVIDNLKCEIVIVPLNVTHKFPLTSELEEILKNFNSEIASFLYKITRKGAEFDREKLNLDGIIMNDPVTVLYMIDNSVLKLKNVDVDIILDGEKEGMSLVTSNDSSNIKFAYDIDAIKCYKILFKRLFNIDL